MLKRRYYAVVEVEMERRPGLRDVVGGLEAIALQEAARLGHVDRAPESGAVRWVAIATEAEFMRVVTQLVDEKRGSHG